MFEDSLKIWKHEQETQVNYLRRCLESTPEEDAEKSFVFLLRWLFKKSYPVFLRGEEWFPSCPFPIDYSLEIATELTAALHEALVKPQETVKPKKVAFVSVLLGKKVIAQFICFEDMGANNFRERILGLSRDNIHIAILYHNAMACFNRVLRNTDGNEYTVDDVVIEAHNDVYLFIDEYETLFQERKEVMDESFRRMHINFMPQGWKAINHETTEQHTDMGCTHPEGMESCNWCGTKKEKS